MDKKIRKQTSTLRQFQKAEQSLQKSLKTLSDFSNSKPELSRENKLAIISGLFAPQWLKNVTYNEIRIALVRACWEKMCLYPQNNIAVRRAINDLSQFAFYAQKNRDMDIFPKMGKICYEMTKGEIILDPQQAQNALRSSSWGVNKAIALVLAKPGQWQKMSRVKKDRKGFLHYLTEHKRIWR